MSNRPIGGKDRIGGTKERTVRSKDLLAKAPSGQFGPTVPTFSPQKIRACIEAQLCPWCGRGPWKVLAGHVNAAHGIDAMELRDLAGFTKNTSICSEEQRSRMSKHMSRLIKETDILERAASAPKGKRRISEAGKKVNREKLAAWAEQAGPEGVRQQREKAGKARGDLTRMQRGKCIECGEQIAPEAHARAKVCSDECLRASRSRSAKAYNEKRWHP